MKKQIYIYISYIYIVIVIIIRSYISQKAGGFEPMSHHLGHCKSSIGELTVKKKKSGEKA